MEKVNSVKVSIIVPVYNTQKYLERCITSLIRQTLREIEIILVDDGSVEECAKLCDAWKAKDRRIRVIHKQNEGLGYARNTGIEAAQGEYLAFVDSDDYVDVSMYEKLYQKAKAEHTELVVGGYWKVYKNGNREACRNIGIPQSVEGKQVITVLLANMLGSPPSYPSDDYIGMSVWKNLYSTELLRRYDIRFPSEREYISEDIIFHIELLHHVKKAVVVNQPYYYYCQNTGSLSTSYRPDRFRRVKKLYLYEKELLDRYGILEAGVLQLQRTFIANVRVCIMMEAFNGRRNGDIKKARRNIKLYCQDPVLQQVLRGYPYKKLPVKQRIFTYYMIKARGTILYVLSTLQNIRNAKKRG